jgi:hypothetical protein
LFEHRVGGLGGIYVNIMWVSIYNNNNNNNMMLSNWIERMGENGEIF